MIMLIDTYSNFIYEIADTAESLIDDLALNNEALEEFQTSYTDADIAEYNNQQELEKFFERMEEADRQAGTDSALDPSTLSDNFWNE